MEGTLTLEAIRAAREGNWDVDRFISALART
jgi:hypothetical protein